MLNASEFVDLYRYVHVYQLPAAQMIGQTVEGERMTIAPTVMLFEKKLFKENVLSYARAVAMRYAQPDDWSRQRHLHLLFGDPVDMGKRLALQFCIMISDASMPLIGRTPIYTLKHGVRFEDSVLKVTSTTNLAN